MSLRGLRTLQAIARHGSFARAGEAVGLTQSAVSLQIKSLEEEFSVRLFDRSRRLPVLTEAGKIVLEKSGEVIGLYDQIAAALSDEKSIAGRLKLGAVQTALSGGLPEALYALRRTHPRARVQVFSGMSVELAMQVVAGDLDAAVTTEPVRPHPPELVWTPLYQDQFWLVVPPGGDRRSQRELLSEMPFIRFDSKAWAGRQIERELRRMKVVVREEMALDSQEAIIKMVEQGLGVAAVPLSEQTRAKLTLGCLPFGEPQLTRKIVLLERRDRSGNRLASALARAITDLHTGKPSRAAKRP